MNSFDTSIIDFLQRFVQRSHTFDTGVVLLGDNTLLKGGVFMGAFWWLWFFHNPSRRTVVREYLISALLTAIVAILAARSLAAILPFRERPFAVEHFHFIEPFGSMNANLDTWSSFPSDHAVLFFALATGFFFASKRVGILALVYAAVAICLPRLYLGIHWPTDILAGAVLGAALAWIGAQELIRRSISRPLLAWFDREPAWSYATLFLITYQIALLFNDSREIAHFALHTLKNFM